MPQEPMYLTVTVDKFTFQVKAGLWYDEAGTWLDIDPAQHTARVGLSDYRQQSSGDIAFADVTATGTLLAQGDELAGLETVKVDLAVVSPVGGRIREINEGLARAPESINEDPYGAGWLAVIELADWEADRAALLDATAYAVVMKAQAEAEAA